MRDLKTFTVGGPIERAPEVAANRYDPEAVAGSPLFPVVPPRPAEDFIPFPLSAVEGSVPRRLHEIARRHGAADAVVGADLALSFRELEKLSHRLASALLDRGLRSGEPVAVIGHNGPRTLAGFFGVLRAGGVIVAIDPSFPAARNAEILRHAGARLAVVSMQRPQTAATLGFAREDTIIVDETTLPECGDTGYPEPQPGDAAILVYTSGSTGEPKGVAHTHRSLLHLALRRANFLLLSPRDRLSLFYSAAVMGGAYGIFGGLLNGASVHPFDVRQEGTNDIGKWLSARQITVYHSVVSLFRRSLGATDGCREVLPDLRLVVLGGEAALAADVDAALRVLPRRGYMVSGLGSSETGSVCGLRIGHDDPSLTGGVPVGRPLEGMRVSLSDEGRSKTEQANAGEIVVESRHLAAGYWQNDAAKRLVFTSAPGDARLTTHRMGDIGAWDKNGLLWHRGRRDRQVKIRGFRVEPGEVESALRRHPAVADAVVAAHETAPGESRLAAYVIIRPAQTVTSEEFRLHLEPCLPAHMIPAAFIPMAAFPLTVSGKVDRRALPAPDFTARPDQREHVAPRTPIEQAVASVWQELLGLDKVGVNADFFELGGHSLLAMQVVSHMRQAFGVKVSLRNLFEASTVAKLGALIEKTPHPLQPDGPLAPQNVDAEEETF